MDSKQNIVTIYQVQEQLKPKSLNGISDAQINDHWSLYVGYVNQVNKLNQELTILESGLFAHTDRRRRYGFEYNGMVLHEYYFANLASDSTRIPEKNDLFEKIENSWSSFKAWEEDFTNTGKSRGVGWAILYCDPTTQELSNHFITNHENGPIAGFAPILVMDVWEHAYMVDHKAGGRADYISAFMKNINWPVVQERYNAIKNDLQVKRY